MRYPRVAIGLALLVVVAAGGFAYLRGGSTPVGVDAAVERFHEHVERPSATSAATAEPPSGPSKTEPEAEAEPEAEEVPSATGGAEAPGTAPSAASAPDRPVPDEGVYVYATEGGEEVDVFGGTRHDYPEETTITVRHDDCGLLERWDAIEERWSERLTCPTEAGEELRWTKSYHEFYRQGDVRELVCEPGTLARPATNEAGTTWTGRCTSDNTETTITGRIVGEETLSVAGEPVRTLHVRIDAEVTGSQNGHSRADVWGDFETGLVVREVSSTSTRGTEPVIGEVHYQESYELELTSLHPRR